MAFGWEEDILRHSPGRLLWYPCQKPVDEVSKFRPGQKIMSDFPLIPACPDDWRALSERL